MCLLFIGIGVLFTEALSTSASTILNFLITHFDWFYLTSGTIFVILCLYLMFSKYGSIRLGKNTDRPDYSTKSWIAMLFSGGMGVGLVFWAVAEPLYHYVTPPYGEGGTAEAAHIAMQYTFFHWGVFPWAIFAVMGLGLAYFQFRKGLPASISSLFYPVLGDRIYSPIGKSIDILAVFITAIGVASTLGLSTLQINGGLNYLWGAPNTVITQILIIAIATAFFLISSCSGLDKGIKLLSNVNMLIAFALMLSIFLLGPTAQILQVLVSTTGSHVQTMIDTSVRLQPFNSEENAWVSSWTVFYWAWWMTWAPFVGSFVARISKGRTIKEYVLGVLLVPTFITFIWFSIFGGAALHLVHDLGFTALADDVHSDITLALFSFFSYFPLSMLLSIAALILIFTFLITSADSATFVLGMLSDGGNLNPSNQIKIMWGLIIAGSSIVFLLAGGLEAVKTLSIVVASPFTLLMVIICYSILKALKKDGFETSEELEAENESNIDSIHSNSSKKKSS